MNIYDELKERYPNIKMYSEESGDYEDAGVGYIVEKKYDLAKVAFEKVIVAIPDHFNGWELAAYSMYLENRDNEKVKVYLEKAIELARGFEGIAKIDDETLEKMDKNLQCVENGQDLDMDYILEIIED